MFNKLPKYVRIVRIHALQYSILQIMNHGSKTREDIRKHTEDHPLIAPSFNHMTMIITVLTTMTITHKMANILNSILSDTVPKMKIEGIVVLIQLFTRWDQKTKRG